jgi:Co/Zn/Cd efflux system component
LHGLLSRSLCFGCTRRGAQQPTIACSMNRLIVNAGFFVAEFVAGAAAGSAARQADALDFFGDAASYAISLGVAGMALCWRARAALAKGGTLIAFALWVLGGTAWHAFHGTPPQAEVMGIVGVAALIANAGVALMLYRFRTGDANMCSVSICSRNDAAGNAAVLLAAMGVFGTGAGWADVIVAATMGGLGLWGGWQIVNQARPNSVPNAMRRSPSRKSKFDLGRLINAGANSRVWNVCRVSLTTAALKPGEWHLPLDDRGRF